MNQTPTGLQRDMSTAIHLLENLGFVISLTKSQLKPTQTLEFLGFIVDTKNMILALPQGKVTAIKDLCSQMLSQTQLTVRDIARLIGKLTASIQAIFPAPLHYRQLQSLKNIAVQSGGNYNTKVSLNPACQEEVQWWIAHLNAWNGRAILTPPPDLVIKTDASPKRSSELGLLDLNFSKKHPEGISFSLPGMTKTSSEVRTVFFASFPSANAICVTTTLDAYLYRTAQAREHLSSQTGVPNPLFLSYHQPYKPVKPCSIARWIKKFIGSAGINWHRDF